MSRIVRWIRFRLDSFVLGGVGAGVVILAGLTAVVVLICGALLALVDIELEGGETASFLEASWQSLMRTLDPGTMGGDAGWPFRLTSLAATLFGILVLSILIGVITAGIDSRLSVLRKGKGVVQLQEHTVILGWSHGTETLVGELGEANRSRHRPAIVVLAESDVEEMRESLAPVGRIHRHQRVFIRNGSTTSSESLASVSAEKARSIVILHGDVANQDAENIRTTLAVINELSDFQGVIITQVVDKHLADSLREATAGRVLVVCRKEVMSKVTSQVCRSRGLARVYEDLLDFDGSEIYVKEEPSLVGKRFSTVVTSYATSIPIGLLRRDGTTHLCPPWSTIVEPGDEIIGIAEDDSDFEPARTAPSGLEEIQQMRLSPDPRSVLLVGWSEIAPGLVQQLCETLPHGSSLTVCAPDITSRVAGTSGVTVAVRNGDIDRLSELRGLINERSFDNIVLLCGRDRSVVEDDSMNLMRLLEIRQILNEPGCLSAGANIVTELRDAEDVSIAGPSKDDFVVSDRISSLLIAQLSEEPRLGDIFNALFESAGIEILTIPAVNVGCEFPTTFGVAQQRAMRFGIVIGYVSPERGAVLNPGGEHLLNGDDHLRFVVMTRSDGKSD